MSSTITNNPSSKIRTERSKKRQARESDLVDTIEESSPPIFDDDSYNFKRQKTPLKLVVKKRKNKK